MLRVERFLQSKFLLATMILLQTLWLTVTWQTNNTITASYFLLLLLYALAVGGIMINMSPNLLSKLKNRAQQWTKNEKLLLLSLCLLVLIAGVIHAKFRLTASDELGGFEAAKIVAQEGVAAYFAGYGSLGWLGNQHPPLLPLINGLVMRVVGVDLLVTRVISIFLSMGTVVITYLLGKKIYDRLTGLLAALLFISFPIFLKIGAMANNDMLVTFFFALALLLTWHLFDRPSYMLSLALGIVIGAGLLSKYTMIFIFPVLISYIAIKRPPRQVIAYFTLAFLPLMAIFGAWLFYADQNNLLMAHISKLTSYIRLVAKTDYGKDVLVATLSSIVPSALGIYHLPILLLGGSQLIRRRTQADLFILLWLASVFLPVLLTLPLSRYMLPAFPGLAILMARGLQSIPKAPLPATALGLLYCAQALVVYLLITWLFAISRGF